MLNFGHWAYKNFFRVVRQLLSPLAEHFLSSLWSGARALATLRYLCARLTLGLSKFSHVAVITREKLHWLDFSSPCCFQTLFDCFPMSARSGPELFGRVLHTCLLSSWSQSSALCCLGCLGPSQLVSLLRLVSAHLLLHVCPRAWNLLPLDLRTADIGLQTFRKKLKTFLFNSYS